MSPAGASLLAYQRSAVATAMRRGRRTNAGGGAMSGALELSHAAQLAAMLGVDFTFDAYA